MGFIISKLSVMHFLLLSVILFSIGVVGILFNRRNIINILMSIELMLLAASINFVSFSSHFKDLTGQIASIMILSIAAAEAAIGLAIIVVFYRNKGSISTEKINELKG